MSELSVRKDGEWQRISTREAIERFIADGWMDDEIADWFKTLTDLDGTLYYLRDNPADRRRFRSAIAAIRAKGGMIDAEKILAARRDDLAAGGQGGEKAVADRLSTSESTLRRLRVRFGLIPWPENEPLNRA